jgi:hypothetical protein
LERARPAEIRSRPVKVLLATVTLLVLVACDRGASASPTLTGTPPTLNSPDLPTSMPTPVGDVPQEILDLILDEAASLAGMPREQLTVERAEAVTWGDGSLGCPEPGMMYTQVLVDGYWVVIRAGDQTFDFRGSGTSYRLCPPGRGVPPAPPMN